MQRQGVACYFSNWMESLNLIAIDGRELEGKPTGVGNYLRNILEALELRKDWEAQIFFKNEIASPSLSGEFEPVLLRSTKKNLAWIHTVLAPELQKRKVNLFFSPTPNCVPLFHGLQVSVVYDLSYFNHPEWFSPRERWVRRISTRYAIHKASRIYVISDHVRSEIVQRFGTADRKLMVTPIAVQKKKIDPELRRILRNSYRYDSEKIVLYVGSIFQRRHLPVLIQALARLEPDVRLIVIGENRTFPFIDLKRIAAELSVEARVTWLEYATDKTVEDYYRMADVFVYLSTYEGFGIPPLEAMSYGIPTVLSRTPAMDQIYQFSALFVPEITPSSVADAIRACLNDVPLREQLIESGLAQVERSRWSDTARMISDDWEQLLAGRS
jgi:glycosyltransferase involved in cell wall biosynthesis